jgi:hypothetical protein
LIEQFRPVYERHVGEPYFEQLVAGLKRDSEHFARWWEEHGVTEPSPRTKTVQHPLVGALEFERLTFRLVGYPDVELLVDTPVPGTGTAEKLDLLLALLDASTPCPETSICSK